MTLPKLPKELGLPDKFSYWRQDQDVALILSNNSEKRFIIQCCPTGFGKSLLYMAYAKMNEYKTVFLTSTKGLQSQLVKDFSESGLIDIRGKNAYPCIAESGLVSCDVGGCNVGVRCEYKQNGCKYYDAQRTAKSARLVVTNYAYWMNINRRKNALGEFDCIVCDESHALPDIVSSFVETRFVDSDWNYIIPPEKKELELGEEQDGIVYLISWANQELPKVKGMLGGVGDSIKGGNSTSLSHKELKVFQRLETIKRKLTAVTNIDEKNVENYIWSWTEQSGKTSVAVSPLWPMKYAEESLFCGVEKVLLTSATVRPKTAKLLGLDEEDYDFFEYEHSFEVDRRRFVHVPTVRMNKNTTDGDYKKWLNRIDEIINWWGEYNGIVHPVSYRRRDMIINSSKFAKKMHTHNSFNVESVVEKFKSERGKVLVSPAMTTGWDFPGDECRYQVIGKIPYPDMRDKVIKARAKQDKDYAPYIAMLILIQICGRACRSGDDWCWNIIIDDSIKWFIDKYKDFAPKWFMDSWLGSVELGMLRLVQGRMLKNINNNKGGEKYE